MRVLLTGGAGMLGRTFVDAWGARRPDQELVVVTRDDVDLSDRAATRALIERVRPTAVVHAAAKVGGIAAKLAEPATYLLDNLLLDTSVISACLDAGVRDLLYVGTAAVYPDRYERPFVEGDALSGRLEGANEGYALAKGAAARLCAYASTQYGRSYRVAVPSNLYGPHDHFAAGSAHLVAAALGKIHRAREAGDPTVPVWGDGTARREFTYAPDLAAFLVDQVDRLASWPDALNLGCGADHSVREYYEVARDVVGYEGTFTFETDKPSGTPRRLIDSSAARALGWSAPTPLSDGMAATYAAYLASVAAI
ncbi:NAD-dependent epimerase/dehydratase family protein [Cellulomonas sp.]|uniref:NAD-dependent epimerase/dehydratase family protein n=1 Tax=Cellulomonas sp. TaxID=40001 RepID=UPI001B1E8C64|nr:NAD-dependent epimerase/dehydratase family protein [Cellulomonas sp.]MBO9555499.1 NAD-dependent epimerase/dehydratase family protein [Cellulomonas sp.]